MTKLTEIEGIGATYAKTLEDKAHINSSEKLLDACASPSGRKTVAEQTGVSPKLVSKWANRADLSRIKGIGGEFADLLEFSGVDTVPELAQRNAANLHSKMAEVNEQKNLTRRLPSESQVQAWVDQAKQLPRILTY